MLTFNCREQGWLEAQRGLEGGNTGGRGGEAVMRILDPRELFAPGGLVGGGHTSQGRFELCLTIRLWVKAGGETDLSPKGGAEFPPDAGSELRTSVGHNISGDPMETEDVGC